MRLIVTLAVVAMMAFAAQTWAAGPDDQYLEIYNHILQAESSLQAGHSSDAAQQFSAAQAALQKLHDANPNWNPQLVSFRLQYLAKQLASLGIATRPAPDTSAEPAQTAPSTPSAQDLAEFKQVVATFQEQIRALGAANAQLQAKLRDAFSVQPSAVDPQELAKARQTILDLQKQRDLLSASLEQAKAAQPPHPQQSTRLDSLQHECDRLQTELLKAQAAQAADSSKLRLLAPQNQSLLQQNSSLLARLEVLEATAPPYSTQELALLKDDQSPAPNPNSVPRSTPSAISTNPPPVASPSGTSETKPVVHSVKDLPPGAGALMAQGMRYADEKDFAQAEARFNEVLRQDENNVYVLVHVASAQLAQGKLEQCEKNILHALSLDPNDPGSLYLLGILRYRQNKLDDALDALSRSAKLNPTNAGTQNHLGIVLSEKGLYKPAEVALRKALELEPDNPLAHYNLALVYVTEKPPFLALARWHYQKALDDGHPRNSALEKLLLGEADAPSQ